TRPAGVGQVELSTPVTGQIGNNRAEGIRPGGALAASRDPAKAGLRRMGCRRVEGDEFIGDSLNDDGGLGRWIGPGDNRRSGRAAEAARALGRGRSTRDVKPGGAAGLMARANRE